MRFIYSIAPLIWLIGVFTCHSTDPATSTPNTPRLRTETVTRYLPADLVTTNGIALPAYTHSGASFKPVVQLQYTYTYDPQGRLLTKASRETFRPTDVYAQNWTRRYTYLTNELRQETLNLSGSITSTVRLRLNDSGYVVNNLDDPNQVWVYNTDGQLINRNSIEQEYANGNRVRQTNLAEITDYTHDLTKPNPVPVPDAFDWGKPDRNQLVGSTTRSSKSTATLTATQQTAYTYDLNTQGLSSRRIAYKQTKPAPGYTMAQGVSSDDVLEVTEYAYE